MSSQTITPVWGTRRLSYVDKFVGVHRHFYKCQYLCRGCPNCVCWTSCPFFDEGTESIGRPPTLLSVVSHSLPPPSLTQTERGTDPLLGENGRKDQRPLKDPVSTQPYRQLSNHSHLLRQGLHGSMSLLTTSTVRPSGTVQTICGHQTFSLVLPIPTVP